MQTNTRLQRLIKRILDTWAKDSGDNAEAAAYGWVWHSKPTSIDADYEKPEREVPDFVKQDNIGWTELKP